MLEATVQHLSRYTADLLNTQHTQEQERYLAAALLRMRASLGGSMMPAPQCGQASASTSYAPLDSSGLPRGPAAAMALAALQAEGLQGHACSFGAAVHDAGLPSGMHKQQQVHR